MPLQEIGAEDDRLLQDVANRLAKSHKILVITGAGISTSCGIPDFRSKDGLYNLIPEQGPTPVSSVPSTPSRNRQSSEDYFSSSQSSTASTGSRRTSSSPVSKLKGQDLFDASVWKTPHTTEVFYRFIASLRQKIREEIKETSLTHKFIRTLRDGGRLMRCYTQNIDGLERREGLSTDLEHGKGTKKRFMKKIWEAPRPSQSRNSEADGGCEVVPLHGDLEVLRCTLCHETCPWRDEDTENFLDGLAPQCSKCAAKSTDRQERGKRGVAVGSLRPNIVLYGEEHPSNQSLAPLVPFDLSSGPEILIIMGTSLKVHGLQKVVKAFAKKIHTRKDGKGKVLFVNRTKPAESAWDNVIDSYVAMDCDDWVRDLKARREDLFLRQGELDLNVTKPMTKKRKSIYDSSTPSKRPKIVVEVPTKRRAKNATPWKVEVKEAKADSSLMTPPPSRGKGSVRRVDQAPTPEPLTPQHTGDFPMQGNMYEDLFKSLLGNHSTPKPSRLRNTWKPSIKIEIGGLSPQRPEVFSPIEERCTNPQKYEHPSLGEKSRPSLLRNTWKPSMETETGGSSPERSLVFSPIEERPAKLQMYEDLDLEIEESQDEEQDEAASVLDTPTKARVLRPRSDSSLNYNMVKEWSTRANKVASSREDHRAGHSPSKRMSMSLA